MDNINRIIYRIVITFLQPVYCTVEYTPGMTVLKPRSTAMVPLTVGSGWSPCRAAKAKVLFPSSSAGLRWVLFFMSVNISLVTVKSACNGKRPLVRCPVPRCSVPTRSNRSVAAIPSHQSLQYSRNGPTIHTSSGSAWSGSGPQPTGLQCSTVF